MRKYPEPTLVSNPLTNDGQLTADCQLESNPNPIQSESESERGSAHTCATHPPLPEFSSPAMQNAFEIWLEYKRERREAYKPTGLKAFVSHLRNMIEQNGEQAVIDAINYSMAQGYQGIWQEDKRRSTATKAERTQDAFAAWQPDDEPPVVWEEDA